MIVSPSGVSYVGNFGFDLDAMVRDVGRGRHGGHAPADHQPCGAQSRRRRPPGRSRHVTFPTATVMTPDGATLIVGETLAYRLERL